MNSDTSLAPRSLPAEYARWWLTELRALLPETITGWLAGDVAHGDLMADADGVKAVKLVNGRLEAVQQAAYADLSSAPLLRELRTRGHDRVRLWMAPGQCLVKTVTFPAAIEENLAVAIGFELDRITPFKSEQVYFDARVVARNPAADSIDVRVVVAPRAEVDARVALLAQHGISVAEIPVEPAIVGGMPVDLLPAHLKPARRWGQRTRLNLALLALAALLGLLALLVPVWQKRERVVALIPLVSKTAGEFESSRKVSEEYTRLAADYNFISGRKHSAQPVLAVLEEVTKISPDTTYTQSFELKSTGKVRELTMMGEAQSASRVIESLEQSPLFQNATQRAQTTRGSQPNSERYHIATEVKVRPLPPATTNVVELAPALDAVPAGAAPAAAPAAEAKAAPAATDGKTPAADAKPAVPAPAAAPPAAPPASGAAAPTTPRRPS
ncbi:MAG TPA: pilus assembly protein PilM [Usitatibacteraceae bacterium]|nr:pilus assembly protein PilM [Usitatibacteraceae bacterium]